MAVIDVAISLFDYGIMSAEEKHLIHLRDKSNNKKQAAVWLSYYQ